jgi:serralysin
MYVLSDQTGQNTATEITTDHFGANIVTIHDTEFGDATSGMRELVAELNVNTLRYPGGTVTEDMFDMDNPESRTPRNGVDHVLLPMGEFFEGAQAIGADATIVIPTQVAFSQTAAEAALAGTYGNRQVSEAYLQQVARFIERALLDASAAGVQINAFEIGNEFWLGGEMSAAEYGRVAGELLPVIEAQLDALGYGDVQLIVQGTSSASALYAPNGDVAAYVETTTEGELLLHTAQSVAQSYSTIPANFQAVTIPDQGSALQQLGDIAAGINAIPGAAGLIDGTVLHVYQNTGFAGVDSARDFLFSQFERFEQMLGRAGDLDRHVTEWNVQARGTPNNAGLQQASMMVETFYEMLTHGVDTAQVWPLTFNNTQGTSLLDLNDDRLSIAGQAFELMSDVLVGTEAAMDWSVAGEIDVHGFRSDATLHLFVSERGGHEQTDTVIDFSAMSSGSRFFVMGTQLWDGGAGGSNANAEAVVSYTDGTTIRGTQLELDMADWSTTRLDIVAVDNSANIVEAGGGDDRILTYFGADRIFGQDGDDSINGGGGADTIYGGRGNDVIVGARGKDDMSGNEGADLFIFGTTHGQDRIRDFTFGEDILRINQTNYQTINELHADESLTVEYRENSVLIRYGEVDSIELLNMSISISEEDGARVNGDNGTNILLGADAQDDLRGRNGNDVLVDGAGRDYLRGGAGADTFVLVNDGERDRITDFVCGKDLIDITAWGVSDFDELTIEMQYNGSGRFLNRAQITFEDEVLQLSTLDEDFASQLTHSDFVFV